MNFLFSPLQMPFSFLGTSHAFTEKVKLVSTDLMKHASFNLKVSKLISSG